MSIYFFSRKKFANRGFAEHATINSPTSFVGQWIAVVHIGEMKKKVSFRQENLKKDFHGKKQWFLLIIWSRKNLFCPCQRCLYFLKLWV